MRAQPYVVRPDEDAVGFAQLQTAPFEELAPVSALQMVLARRVAIAAWRLARADRLAAGTRLGPVPQPGGQEVEPFEQRRWDGAGVGVALIRDGNGTRSETLMRYRAAAMAEFMRALRTLKALQPGHGTSIEQGLPGRSTGAIARVPSSALPFDTIPARRNPSHVGQDTR
jgi:hypothetical protein